jgi:hypothetical protein
MVLALKIVLSFVVPGWPGLPLINDTLVSALKTWVSLLPAGNEFLGTMNGCSGIQNLGFAVPGWPGPARIVRTFVLVVKT